MNNNINGQNAGQTQDKNQFQPQGKDRLQEGVAGQKGSTYQGQETTTRQS